jgi:hypothetical protein
MSGGTRLLKYSLSLAVSLLLLACAAAPDPTPVAVARRLAFSGYTIVPPLGPGWVRRDPPGTDAGFERPGLASGSRVVLVATARPAPRQYASVKEFLDDMIARQENEAEPRRFHVLQESTSLAPEIGSYCVRTSASAEDRASPGKPVLDAASLACLHPSSPGWLVTVGWSERHPKNASSPDAAAEGERFVNSLRFFDRP